MILPSRRCASLLLLLVFNLATLTRQAHALGQSRFISSSPSTGGFTLAASGRSAPIDVDGNDYPGVIRAAHDLQMDIERVTGLSPHFLKTRRVHEARLF